MPKSLQITVATGNVIALQTPAVVVNHLRQVQPTGSEQAVNNALQGGIMQAVAEGRFEGRLGEMCILPGGGKIAADYVVVVGAGDLRDFSIDVMAPLAAAIALAAVQLKLTRIATVLHGGGMGLKTDQATKTLIKKLVSALALLDPDGAVTDLLFCEINEQKAVDIAGAARAAASVLRTRAAITVRECSVADLATPGRTVQPAAGPASPPVLPPFPYEPNPVYLDISHRGDYLYFRVLDKKPILQIQKKLIPIEFLQDLTHEMTRVSTTAAGRTPDEVRRELQDLGTLAYSQLLNNAVRERMRTFPNSPLILILDKTTIAIPWELLHDRQEFLCRKYPVARRIIIEGVGPSPRTEVVKKPLRMLIVSNPTGDLPGAEEECRRLEAAFSDLADFSVSLMKGQQVTRMALLRELNSGRHHLLHYAGHAVFDHERPENSAWSLADGDMSASEIGSLENVPALIFANACESGATAEWGGGYTYDGRVYGLASAFLQAGVNNYIGPFWRIHDEASSYFAIMFYNELLYGASLGQALQAARESVIQIMGWNELTWAGYMLYGDPTYTLVD